MKLNKALSMVVCASMLLGQSAFASNEDITSIEITQPEAITVTEDTYGGQVIEPRSLFANGIIEIASVTDLQNIQNDLSADYVLTQDIDLTGIDWTPIGTESDPFIGNFDGQGHIITGLTLNPDHDYYGLFGYIASDETKVIGNVDLNDVIINYTGSSISHIGSFAGYVENNVQNVNVTGTWTITNQVTGDTPSLYTNIGGVIGSANEVRDSSFQGTWIFKGTSDIPINWGSILAYDTNSNIGGVAGSFAQGDNLTSNVFLSANSITSFGGIVGETYKLTNSDSTLDVSISNKLDRSASGIAKIPNKIYRGTNNDSKKLTISNNNFSIKGSFGNGNYVGVGVANIESVDNDTLEFINNTVNMNSTQSSMLYYFGGLAGYINIRNESSILLDNNHSSVLMEEGSDNQSIYNSGLLIGYLMGDKLSISATHNTTDLNAYLKNTIYYYGSMVGYLSSSSADSIMTIQDNEIKDVVSADNSIGYLGTVGYAYNVKVYAYDNEIFNELITDYMYSGSSIMGYGDLVEASRNHITSDIKAADISYSGGISGTTTAADTVLISDNTLDVSVRSDTVSSYGGLVGQSSGSMAVDVINNNVTMYIATPSITTSGGLTGYVKTKNAINNIVKVSAMFLEPTAQYGGRINTFGGLGSVNADDSLAKNNLVDLDITWMKGSESTNSLNVFYAWDDVALVENAAFVTTRVAEDYQGSIPAPRISYDSGDTTINDTYIVHKIFDDNGVINNFIADDSFLNNTESKNSFFVEANGTNSKFTYYDDFGTKKQTKDLTNITFKSEYPSLLNNPLWRMQNKDGVDIPRLEWQNLGQIQNIQQELKDGSMILSWDAMPGAEYYIVYRNNSIVVDYDNNELEYIGGNNENEQQRLMAYTVPRVQYTDADIREGTNYTYEVYAIKPYGSTLPNSLIVDTTPPKVDPPIVVDPPVDPPVVVEPPVEPPIVTPPVTTDPGPTSPVQPQPSPDPSPTPSPKPITPEGCKLDIPKDNKLRVLVNCREIIFPDVQPYMNKATNRIMIPLRAVFEDQDIQNTAKWLPKIKTAEIVSNNGRTLQFKVGSFDAVKDGVVAGQLDTKPFIYQGRVLLPLRAYIELMGANVSWSKDLNSILIYTDKEYEKQLLPLNDWKSKLEQFNNLYDTWK